MNQIASTTLTRNRDEDPAWAELHTKRLSFAERVEHTSFGEYGSLYVYNRNTESKAHQGYMNRLKRFLGTGALSTLDVQFGPDLGGPILSSISRTFGGHEFYVFGLESPDPKVDMQYALAISDRVLGTIRGKVTRFSNFLDTVHDQSSGVLIKDQSGATIANNPSSIRISRPLLPEVNLLP